jgi:hypothetical protein
MVIVAIPSDEAKHEQDFGKQIDNFENSSLFSPILHLLLATIQTGEPRLSF